jgi:dTDP-4-dehydrorhamnose reductase
MRAIVTGANGLLGQRVIRVLQDAGYSVIGMGRGPRRIGSNFDYLPIDLADPASVKERFADVRADVIIHTAAMTDVDQCEHAVDEAFQVNVGASQAIAAAARKADAHLVYVSTDYVFDGQNGPYTEEAIPNPLGRYAQTKLAGELVVRVAAGSWTIARTAVVYGWPPAGRANFASWIINSLRQGKAIKLFQDQMVSPTLADNAAGMVAELGTRRLKGVWHVSGADIVNRVAFGNALCQIFGFNPSLITSVSLADVPLSGPRPRLGGLVTGKATAELQAKPMHTDEALLALKAAYDASSKVTQAP